MSDRQCKVCENYFPPGELEEHHVAHKPEVTINVCGPCHMRIHRDNGKLEHLNPNSDDGDWGSETHVSFDT